tara:strand:- start:1351 stop:1941 length:591 start_codon:yes stop_codon:yes gene_type:complete
MASEVQIAKLALQHIGDRFDISDLTESTPEAEQVNLIFVDTRDALLRQHPWNFAKKYATPAALTATVPGNWDYAYIYPTDAVRVLGVIDPLETGVAIKFEVARNENNAKVILTDQVDAEFYYTAKITDSTQFDPEFTMALSYKLAAKLAMPLTGERAIAGDMDTLATNTINSAWETDSNEGIEEDLPEAPWIQARA